MRLGVTAVAAVMLSGVLGACGSSAAKAKPPDDPGAPMIPVTLTDTGCKPTDFTLGPGQVVFVVTNPGTTKVTEMEVQDPNGHVRADVEGVTPGHTRSLRVTLEAGVTYRVRCPESAPTGGSIRTS
jgi:iron uptake system component EfeO